MILLNHQMVISEVKGLDLQRLKGEIVAVYGTQLEFSKAIGWHKNKVSKMVCGKYKPDTDEVAAIVSALHLSEQQYWNIFLPNLSPNCDKSTSFNLKRNTQNH